MSYKILPVSAADIPALYECVCKVFSETDFMLISAGELDNSFDNFRKHLEQVIASSKNCSLIARDDDQVIGWIDVSGSHFKKVKAPVNGALTWNITTADVYLQIQ